MQDCSTTPQHSIFQCLLFARVSLAHRAGKTANDIQYSNNEMLFGYPATLSTCYSIIRYSVFRIPSDIPIFRYSGKPGREQNISELTP